LRSRFLAPLVRRPVIKTAAMAALVLASHALLDRLAPRTLCTFSTPGTY